MSSEPSAAELSVLWRARGLAWIAYLKARVADDRSDLRYAQAALRKDEIEDVYDKAFRDAIRRPLSKAFLAKYKAEEHRLKVAEAEKLVAEEKKKVTEVRLEKACALFEAKQRAWKDAHLAAYPKAHAHFEPRSELSTQATRVAEGERNG